MRIQIGFVDNRPDAPGLSAPIKWYDPFIRSIPGIGPAHDIVRRWRAEQWDDTADPFHIWIDSYWWIGQLPPGTQVQHPAQHAGRESDIWNKVQASFPDIAINPDIGIIFRGAPMNPNFSCLKTSGGNIWDDWYYSPQEAVEQPKTPEDVLVEVTGQPMEEILTPGADRQFWQILAQGIGIAAAVAAFIPVPPRPDTDSEAIPKPTFFGIINSFLQPWAGPIVGGLFQAWNSDVIALIDDIEKWTATDLDADEILGALNHWAGTPDGEATLTGIVAMYAAKRAGKMAEAQQAAAKGEVGMMQALTLSDYLDMIHDLTSDEIIPSMEEIQDQLDKLVDGGDNQLKPLVRDMGHYFKASQEEERGSASGGSPPSETPQV